MSDPGDTEEFPLSPMTVGFAQDNHLTLQQLKHIPFGTRQGRSAMKKISYALLPLVLVACATNKPVLYNAAGTPAKAEAAIAECEHLAAAAGAQPTGGQLGQAAREGTKGAALGAATGVVGGAIAGQAGRGAGIGAATGATVALISSLFSAPAPNPAYRAYVEHCLRDKGFDPVGWN